MNAQELSSRYHESALPEQSVPSRRPSASARTRAQPLALVVKRRDYPTKAVLDALVDAGYHIVERNSTGSVELAADLRPQLIVAAVSLSRATDLELVRELAQSCDAFLLVLADVREGFAAGLLAGAQACLSDADGPEVFAAQVASIFRHGHVPRPEPPRSATVSAGPLAMEPAAHRAAYDGRPFHLSPAEYAILLYLVQHQGTVCRADRIVEVVMGDKPSELSPSDRLKTYVRRIRRQLRELAPGSEMIANVHGVGYRLDVPGRGEISSTKHPGGLNQS